MYEFQSWDRGSPIALEAPERAELDFARLVGDTGWNRLPKAVRRRFSGGHHLSQRYVGTMQILTCSWLGYLLAQLCRLFGTPFAPFEGVNIPVTIALKPEERGHGIIWERVYAYPGRPLRVVQEDVGEEAEVLAKPPVVRQGGHPALEDGDALLRVSRADRAGLTAEADSAAAVRLSTLSAAVATR